MNFFKNAKATVRSPDRDIDYFDIVSEVLTGDTFAPYISIICFSYELQISIYLMIENGFTLKKQEIEDIQQIPLRIQAMQMIRHFTKRLNGNNTRMLRDVLNKSLKHNPTKQQF